MWLGFQPTASHSADRCLSHWANRAAASSGYQRFFLTFFLSQVFFLSEVFPHMQREASFRQLHVIVKWCIKGCPFHGGHILDLTETENCTWKARLWHPGYVDIGWPLIHHFTITCACLTATCYVTTLKYKIKTKLHEKTSLIIYNHPFRCVVGAKWNSD